jgi:hypothetical protein
MPRLMPEPREVELSPGMKTKLYMELSPGLKCFARSPAAVSEAREAVMEYEAAMVSEASLPLCPPWPR